MRNGKLHFSLIDPDPTKLSLEEIKKRAKLLEKWGSDVILVGGSTNFTKETVDSTIKAIKSVCSMPIVIYPGNISSISEHADAILFMSLLNSRNPYWISQAQAKAAPILRKIGLEPISMAYLVCEPGMTVGKVGEANLIKTPQEAVAYATSAELTGFHFVYLEAGSGATTPVTIETVRAVRAAIKVPLIVGGGLRTAEAVSDRLAAGADIIVTGTAIENEIEKLEPIIKAIKSFKI
jgi:phosphoglycerol geranylgeranyltransferase